MTVSEARVPVRRMRPEDRREQILGAAFELISTSGFNAVSLADVAGACGIQKSSVLHHFPSMNHLLLAVLNRREEQDLMFYIDGSELAKDGGPSAARELFTRVFQHNLERPELIRLYAILSAEALAPAHPAHDYFIERAKIANAEVASSLSWKPSPTVAASELLAFWQGLEASGCHDPSLDTREVWDAFCDRFFV